MSRSSGVAQAGERDLIFSERAEMALLGTMLNSPNEIGEVLARVREDDFYRDAHRKLFRVVVDMAAGRRPLDLALVAEEVIQRGWKEDLGGDRLFHFIAEVYDAGGSSMALESHVAVVKRYAVRRAARRVGHDIVAKAEDAGIEPDDLLDWAEGAVLALAESGVSAEGHTAADVVGEVYDLLDRLKVDPRAGGVSTGLSSLDDLLGGLRPGELVVVAARPSVGKTALAATLATNAALAAQVPTFFVSLEMPRVDLVSRMVAGLAGVDSQVFRTGELIQDEVAKVSAAGDRLRAAPLAISDHHSQGVLRIAASARRRVARDRLGLLVIDYLQLIEPDNTRDPRHEQVARISRRLKLMARDLGIPVVVCAQLNRESEHRSDRRPRLCDLRESGAIEADADSVLLLHRPDDRPADLDVMVAKNRNGPVGEAILRFERRTGRLTDPHGEAGL
ncbi:MAG: DnaB-like helicase C-terminal domain-containing protein [Gemmataceae bacterium]